MNQTLGRAFVGFHLTLASVVFFQSVVTALEAFGAELGVNWPLFALASVEAVAAVLFVIPATLRVGGITLCLVFLVAIIAHAIIGDFALHLFVYGAGTVFILVHGAARPSLAK